MWRHEFKIQNWVKNEFSQWSKLGSKLLWGVWHPKCRLKVKCFAKYWQPWWKNVSEFCGKLYLNLSAFWPEYFLASSRTGRQNGHVVRDIKRDEQFFLKFKLWETWLNAWWWSGMSPAQLSTTRWKIPLS